MRVFANVTIYVYVRSFFLLLFKDTISATKVIHNQLETTAWLWMVIFKDQDGTVGAEIRSHKILEKTQKHLYVYCI
jgi:hypothetical protein